MDDLRLGAPPEAKEHTMGRQFPKTTRSIRLEAETQAFLTACFGEDYTENKQKLPECYIDASDFFNAVSQYFPNLKGFDLTIAFINAMEGAGVGAPTETEMNKEWLARANSALSDPACEAEANAIRDMILADSDHTHTSTHDGNP